MAGAFNLASFSCWAFFAASVIFLKFSKNDPSLLKLFFGRPPTPPTDDDDDASVDAAIDVEEARLQQIHNTIINIYKNKTQREGGG